MFLQSFAAEADENAQRCYAHFALNVSAIKAGDDALEATELDVLSQLLAIHHLGGRPARAAPLASADRQQRLAALLALWASGCRRVIDERLFSDLLSRHPEEAKARRKGDRHASG